ncbi:hypothetical protein [Desulfofundulus salinus]|uniref:DUF155 domain-containing protein n=1 Tax=Desulfofundulus salinus TaxID=2419843 RepID=A0A494X378_9FIRM|nr:hypothetical protein [Desulfofundulus salinum]RKO67635.1 hypothetical protein D7024_12170 [Desulfofundulus salinum]
MSNSIWLYRLYDVAEEIKLDIVEQTLAHTKLTSRLRLSRARLKSIHIPNPPVTVELGEEWIKLGRRDFRVRFTGKIYDLGVVSLIMHILLPMGFSYQEIRDLAVYLSENEETEGITEGIFQSKLEEVIKGLGKAMIHPGLRGAEEDYILFFFQEWNQDWDPVPLLLAEPEPVSPQVRRETLQHSFSYGPDDLTIITWASALVYDAAGSHDIPDLLEFALTQLLELRYYDNLLSEEMGKMYDDIEEAERVTQLRRLGHYRHIMNRLMELVVDINEILERIQNSLKVTEDVFYARVYGAALSVFRTRAWVESIQRKLSVIMQNYTMLSNRLVNQQSVLLELAIVLLFLLEIFLTLPSLIH